MNILTICFNDHPSFSGLINENPLFSVQVSWVRHRDIHLLTVGRYTYTSDQRFEAVHSPHTEDWTLRIRYPQKKDTGIYECQISTTPPIGHPVYLNVVGRYTSSTVNSSSRTSNRKRPPKGAWAFLACDIDQVN